MAGSLRHILSEDRKHYSGFHHLEHLGDAAEAVDELIFLVGRLSGEDFERCVKILEDEFYPCLRGEQPWPEFMKPGVNLNNLTGEEM